jgi:glycosyltransferase involved in cell wall biosynthesis
MTSRRMTKLVISSNTAWSLFNFRAGLIRALVSEGYEVVAVAPYDEYASRLATLGCRFIPLPMDNKGTHPGRDFLLLCRYWMLLAKERPAAYLGYTVKPNVYGSLAARTLGIPVINNIAGLGVVFIKDSFLTKVVKALYRLALSRSFRIFFQNEDDRKLFIQSGLVEKEKTDRLPGSGVDLSLYVPKVQAPSSNVVDGEKKGTFRFLLAARMLWDKGVGVYVEAARLVKQRYPHVEFCLLGFMDVKNPAAISREQMSEWNDEGVIRYLGVTDDMKAALAETDCVVLPSFYREGVPRTLLEAAAMACPVITTDAVGCREAVDDEVNGFLVHPRDPNDLAEKMVRMIKLSSEARALMGHAGRRKMELEFDEKIVIRRYLEVIRELQ